MPMTWSGAQFHHQFNEDLTLSADAYAPWTTHNTWRTQFVSLPGALPDLEIGTSDGGSDVVWAAVPADGGSIPLGAPETISVTVHNVGCTSAFNVPLALYLGDPADGGRLLGTQTVAGPIANQGGTATATFVWTAWPEGQDLLYAIANPAQPDGGHAIQESGYENNTGKTTAWVRQGTNLADLTVSGGDFGASLGYQAGQPVNLDIKVSNRGPVNAGPFQVVVSDGAGGLGPVLGTIAVSGLASGKSTTVQVSNWIPSEGPHVLTAIADPTHAVPDSNLSNNTGVIFLTIGQASLPDIAVAEADLALSPGADGAVVQAGTQVQLTTVIHNYGAPVANVPLQIVLDPGAAQTILATTVLVPTLETGAAITFATTIDTSQLAQTTLVNHTVEVQLDPNHVIAEYDRSNDSAAVALAIGGTPAKLSIATDHPSYAAASPVAVTLSLQGEGTASKSYALSVEVETAAGLPVAALASGWTVPLGSGVGQSFPFAWNTGETAAGSYQVVGTLSDPVSGNVISSAKALFAIAPNVDTVVTTTPLLASYTPNGTAVVATHLDNKSRNAALDDVTLLLTVKTPTNGPFFSSTREHLTVGYLQDLQLLDAVAIPPGTAAGSYPITAALQTASGTVLASGLGHLTIAAPAIGDELSASVTATPAAFAPGTNITLTANLFNLTSAALNSQPVVLEVVNPITHAVLKSFASNNNLPAKANTVVSDVWTTAGVATGSYLVAVTVNGTAVAHTTVTCDAAGAVPPLIVITGVSDGELTNQTVTPVINITAPSGTFTSTATLDGAAFTSSTAVSAAATHFLSVHATDSKGNTASTTLSFTIYKTGPTIIVGGLPAGPYSNVAAVTPTVRITDPYLDPSRTTYSLNSAAFYLGSSITGEAAYSLVVSATDKAGNSTTSTSSFTLDRTPPVVTITGVTNGQITNAASVHPTLSITDAHLDSSKTKVTLNGAPFTSGTAVTSEGDYTLYAFGEDLATNSKSVTVTFALDRTAPAIAVTGVVNNQNSAGPVTVSFSASDKHPKSTSATLDGAAFGSGSTVTAGGAHTLVVTSTDQAGNTASQTDKFTINPPSAQPFFSPGVCAGSIALADNSTVAPASSSTSGHAVLLNSSGPLSEVGAAVVQGSAWVQGNVSLADNASLTGTAKYGGTETLSGQASVGTSLHQAGFTSPCCPFNAQSAVVAASADNDNAQLSSAIKTLVSDAGTFAASAGTVTFPSGVYYFNGFTASKTAAIRIAQGAVVDLFVKGGFTVQDQATFAGDPNRVKSLAVVASGNITLSAGQVSQTADGGGVTIVGDYAMPALFYSGGAVAVSQSTQVTGAVAGTSVSIANNGSVFVPLSLVPADGGVVCQ